MSGKGRQKQLLRRQQHVHRSPIEKHVIQGPDGFCCREHFLQQRSYIVLVHRRPVESSKQRAQIEHGAGSIAEAYGRTNAGLGVVGRWLHPLRAVGVR